MSICAKCFGELPPNANKCPTCGHFPSDADVFKTRYSANDLLSLGVSATLIKFIMEEPRTGIFEYRCDAKYGGWLCHIPENVTAVYPLWSCNGDLTVIWLRDGNREFVQTYHDDPESTFLAFTEQGLLAHLFQPLMESQEWNTPLQVAQSEECLLDAASRLNFKYMREFLELYSQSGKAHNRYFEQIEVLKQEIDKRNRGSLGN